MFPQPPGIRQIMEIDVESAMTSCGYAVPKLKNLAERDTLEKYWQKKSPAELEQYHRDRNRRSIDGLPTGLPAK